MICSQNKALDLIYDLPDIYDEPLGDPSAIPTLLLSQFTREHVKVALSGDGGDELMAGYDKYFSNLNVYNLISKLPQAINKIFKPFLVHYPN